MAGKRGRGGVSALAGWWWVGSAERRRRRMCVGIANGGGGAGSRWVRLEQRAAGRRESGGATTHACDVDVAANDSEDTGGGKERRVECGGPAEAKARTRTAHAQTTRPPRSRVLMCGSFDKGWEGGSRDRDRDGRGICAGLVEARKLVFGLAGVVLALVNGEDIVDELLAFPDVGVADGGVDIDLSDFFGVKANEGDDAGGAGGKGEEEREMADGTDFRREVRRRWGLCR
ncbi:hypothetical protein R3P38DRAFT_3430747 [Favolaschia claudopus]|uniref:Uncharacterized protein n=1 Tax=Favolaschia claudopus TaxID=2862362 RepID=A0AAV9ZUR6_9AGAR